VKWKIAYAKLNFSDLIRKTEKEPQFIFNRNKMVAVVMRRREYEEIEKVKETVSGQKPGSVLKEFSSLCLSMALRLLRAT